MVAGEALVEVTAVGDESKAGAISKNLKRYKPELTPLQRLIQRTITWLTYGAVVVAAAIFVNYYFEVLLLNNLLIAFLVLLIIYLH